MTYMATNHWIDIYKSNTSYEKSLLFQFTPLGTVDGCTTWDLGPGMYKTTNLNWWKPDFWTINSMTAILLSRKFSKLKVRPLLRWHHDRIPYLDPRNRHWHPWNDAVFPGWNSMVGQASVTNGGKRRPVCEESMGIFLLLVMLLKCDKGW